MDDMKISLSVPATIYDFGETENLTNNKYVTHAKLKVFSVGATGDKRVFTKQFSDQLLQTLPSTPVVAYYDEDEDDFKGHHIIQYVFGYVPENATISYVDEVLNGNKVTFAVTDVLLFTGRQDNIGAIASKIIGHAHSLELDPKTAKYEIVRSGGKIESVTFKEGSFIGLSVLGTNEKPAFAGSAFFTEGSELDLFVNSFKEFKEEVELYKSGGEKMDNETNLPNPKSYQEFKKSSLTEKINSVVKALENQGYYGYFIDAIDESYVFRVYMEDSAEFYRIKQVDGAITSMEVVYPRYLTEAEINNIEAPNFTESTNEEITEAVENTEVEEQIEEVIEQVTEATEAAIEEPVAKETETFEEVTETVEETVEENLDTHIVVEAQVLEGLEDDRETTKQEEGQGAQAAYVAALNDAERQELNEYRKKVKFELIDSYEDVDEQTRAEFKVKHLEFSIDQLDKELAYALVKSQRQNKKVGVKVFSLINEPAKPMTVVDYVNQYKDKK